MSQIGDGNSGKNWLMERDAKNKKYESIFPTVEEDVEFVGFDELFARDKLFDGKFAPIFEIN